MSLSSAPSESTGEPRLRLGKTIDGNVRIVCVGDVHGQWSELDEEALAALSPDVVLFVGDYGNENVAVVKRIADFSSRTEAQCAAVLGNHDGFYTMSHIGRERCPYDSTLFDRVQEQLDLLAPINPSYRSLTLKSPVQFSVVGGRPFSWGGPHWKHSSFYRKYYQVEDMSQSSERITNAALTAGHDSVIFLSHSGPTGLGEKPGDPCGRDWGSEPGGDYGDEDLRQSIDAARKGGKAVPLVVFGHMHHILDNNLGQRTMLSSETDPVTGKVTVMLDTAVVPRNKKHSHRLDTLSQFSIVELNANSTVVTVEQVWASRRGEIVEAKLLYDNRLVTAI